MLRHWWLPGNVRWRRCDALGGMNIPLSLSRYMVWPNGHGAGDFDLDMASPATQLGCIGTDTDEMVWSWDNEPLKLPGISRPYFRKPVCILPAACVSLPSLDGR